VPIFTESIICPVVAASTCTYQIILESQNVVSTSDNGLYQFLVDGVAPNPGPTDGSGRESFVNHDPNSGGTDFFVRHNGSYTVTATVTNSTGKPAHAIAVNIGCADSAPPRGCIGESGVLLNVLALPRNAPARAIGGQFETGNGNIFVGRGQGANRITIDSLGNTATTGGISAGNGLVASAQSPSGAAGCERHV
jgi:hypothetical protein